jgi:hypothetical protein
MWIRFYKGVVVSNVFFIVESTGNSSKSFKVLALINLKKEGHKSTQRTSRRPRLKVFNS